MVKSDGKNFNSTLLKLIDARLNDIGSSLEDIDTLIRENIYHRGIPTASGIYLDARRRYKLNIRADYFKLLLDLAGYCGFFRYASSRTYFPY